MHRENISLTCPPVDSNNKTMNYIVEINGIAMDPCSTPKLARWKALAAVKLGAFHVIVRYTDPRTGESGYLNKDTWHHAWPKNWAD